MKKLQLLFFIFPKLKMKNFFDKNGKIKYFRGFT